MNLFGESFTETKRHFHLLIFDWNEVSTAYSISAWLLLASMSKLFFHVNKRIAEALPDSALLIALGFVLGFILRLCQIDHRIYMLQSPIFFLYLLPPIIFDAGFFMPNRQLFENFDSVLLFAFVGTIWNTIAIGYSLNWMGQVGFFSVPFTTFQILLFASLISSVDPVAVIGIFEEIRVNEFLFINVFGEALFNDGAAVTLYKMFQEFTNIGPYNLHAMDYIEGILSFFVIAIGGVILGLFFAALTCIATKYTHVRLIAPIFVFVVPYMSYLTAEMFGISSILAITACTIAMKQYVKGNLSHDAYSSVKYFTKMLAQCSETVIFLFLGFSLVSREYTWDWTFVCSTIAFCLIHRTVGVVVQCAVLNLFRRKKFSFTDQFVLSYGGLRGAIAFGLVMSTNNSADQFPARSMFISTTLAVIFFTVFVQGISIRPLLFWLKVEKSGLDGLETMMSNKIFERYTDHTMSGLEAIIGHKGTHSLRDAFERFNNTVLTPFLMRSGEQQRKTYEASPIVRAYHKITLQEALQLAQSGSKISKKTKKITRCQSQSESLPPTSTILRSVSRVGAQQMTDIDQFLSNRENVELLYLMFSRMLDRKIEEMQKARVDSGWEDDIKDDYMGIIGAQVEQPENEISSTRRTARNKKTTFLFRRESSLPTRTRRVMVNRRIFNDKNIAANIATTKNGNGVHPRRKFSLPLNPEKARNGKNE
ncbi:hypothetical protein niasHS_017388 [Heterodera schachtii]|uniref:Sodium/hydrogen exchanger n=1 Tax=Heterodera schachtii TaxID=97005 RepID=A0ABD2HTV8_HETSC